VPEGAAGDGDIDRDRLASVSVDGGEAGQPFRWPLDGRLRPGRVHLDDLAAPARSGIPHSDPDRRETGLIDFTQPVTLMLVAIVHFLTAAERIS
jgi:hypothetical protein